MGLGSQLFIIYINDFSNCTPDALGIHFADDTTIVNSHLYLDEFTEKMDDCVNQAKNSFKQNKLSLNDIKTLNMIFTLRSSNIINHTQVKFAGTVLDQGSDGNNMCIMFRKN